MAAPAFTARQAPTGKQLEDPYPTTFAFADDPDISIWERSVKPPGFDIGDPINLTSMHNTDYKTKAARQLADTTSMTLSGFYDPRVFAQIKSQLGVQQAITVHHPNGDQMAFWGYLKSMEPQDNEEGGDSPMADVEIVPTNRDPNTGSEQGPVYTYNSGTGS